jgi:hypothetical protein
MDLYWRTQFQMTWYNLGLIVGPTSFKLGQLQIEPRQYGNIVGLGQVQHKIILKIDAKIFGKLFSEIIFFSYGEKENIIEYSIFRSLFSTLINYSTSKC